MNFGIVIYVQSILILFIGFFQIFPLLFSIYYDGNDTMAFIESLCITIVIGSLLNLITKRYRKSGLKARESFAIVTFGWIVAALFSTLPLLLHSHSLGYAEIGTINNFTDAYFEMMSGFTTTGSSILTDIEAMPKGILFWRSLSHWLGGMGIILLAVAILPLIGIGGMQLYRAEVPGPMSDKLAPRISETAKILWGVYLVFTVLETILLMFAGMDFFDALCHSFGTVATGGFSTKNESIGYYGSAYIDTIIIIFMFLAGVSFALHYRVMVLRDRFYFRDREFRFYFIIIVFISFILMASTYEDNFSGDILVSFRYVLFQVVSILTTTGYGVGIGSESVYHFAVWSIFSQFLIILLMFMGGCAGSTSGGIKLLRVYLIFKFVYTEFVKFIYPRHIKLVRVGREHVGDSILLSTLGFVSIYIIIMFVSMLLVSIFEGDLVESFTAVVATLNNIGPGLGRMGPDGNFSSLADFSKWVLIFCMLLGRLELYGVLILFFPFTWVKD